MCVAEADRENSLEAYNESCPIKKKLYSVKDQSKLWFTIETKKNEKFPHFDEKNSYFSA